MAGTKKYTSGEVIFNKGAFEQCMYRVVSGKIGIYENFDTEDALLLTEIKPDGIFGEMGLLDYMPRSATAVALEDSELLVIEDEELNGLLESDPELIYEMLKSIGKRIAALTNDYHEVCADIHEYLETAEAARPKSLIERILNWMSEGQALAVSAGYYRDHI